MKWKKTVALAAALLLLAGCGKSLTEKASEKAAEGLLNKVLGEAGVQFDADQGSLTITGDDGETVNIGRTEAGAVPKGFVLPVLPGMKPGDFVETRTSGHVSWVGGLFFDGDPEQTALAYEQALQGMGLEPNMQASRSNDGYMAMFMPSGTVNGQAYAGILTLTEGGGEAGQGKHSLTVVFGEVESDS